jgi:NADH dehydrogenase
MIIERIAMLGGSGFVGRTLANRLTREGYTIRILTRNPDAVHADLRVLPGVELVQADIHDIRDLADKIAGTQVVINLVGILNEKGRNGAGFRFAHVELAGKVLQACRDNHIRRLLHMSALNADAVTGTSHYLRTKGEAEDIVHAAADLNVTSFRPSVIFGPGDDFFNRFAVLLKRVPVMFPLACPGARFAPVYVGDIAAAFTRAMTDSVTYGKRYDLCGPHQYTLQELVQYTALCCGINRLILPLPDMISRIQAAVFDFVPGKPFSTDNYLSAKLDSVCQCNAMEQLGIKPVALDAVVPGYLSVE